MYNEHEFRGLDSIELLQRRFVREEALLRASKYILFEYLQDDLDKAYRVFDLRAAIELKFRSNGMEWTGPGALEEERTAACRRMFRHYGFYPVDSKGGNAGDGTTAEEWKVGYRLRLPQADKKLPRGSALQLNASSLHQRYLEGCADLVDVIARVVSPLKHETMTIDTDEEESHHV